MQKIGITGGIGSGKSLVCRVFNEIYHIPHFNADREAKTIMTRNTSIKKQLIGLLGPKSYNTDGTLNRQYIANIVFNDDEKLRELNQIVHRQVRYLFEKWVALQKSPYILHEAAVTIESGFHTQLHQIITVNAPEKVRIKRVLERDKLSKEQILQRIEKQLSDEARSQYADFIIINDNIHSIIKQIRTIHKNIISYG